ncbi:hypothetical protein [Peptoclostridium litorale]|uniref:hypothetical protein n=1 Tax=Peptoclostridium litorale TaxID=1557 RepID=UPI001A9A6DE2|nr:hypothetical protein [Peptoclostridium litorale]
MKPSRSLFKNNASSIESITYSFVVPSNSFFSFDSVEIMKTWAIEMKKAIDIKTNDLLLKSETTMQMMLIRDAVKIMFEIIFLSICIFTGSFLMKAYF